MADHGSCASGYVVGSSGATASNLNGELAAHGRHLCDEYGRVVLPRGASLSGLSKLPARQEEGEPLTFVGRPFPLEEAPLHLQRLQQWGLTFLRLVAVWEALEPLPGVYDEGYLDYVLALVKLFPAYGIKCYIDAHQDVFSRFTGGSGAPSWTFSAVGFDIENLKATGASHVHPSETLEGSIPHVEVGETKVWPSGYTKLGALTMNTLFFAGDTFARKRLVEGFPVQQYLQSHFIEAYGRLADRLRDEPAVIGFEVFNEPHRGYVELISPFAWDHNTDLAIGPFPSALQGWALGSGYPVLLDVYTKSFPVSAKSSQLLLAPTITAWLPGLTCPWQDEGVWEWDPKRRLPVSLRSDYFSKDPATGKEVEWYRDFYWPFVRRFSERMGGGSTFVGPIPNELAPTTAKEIQPTKLIFAPHFYDLHTLFSQSVSNVTFNVQALSRGAPIWEGIFFGRQGMKKNYARQVINIVEQGYRSLGEVPTIIGETGIPFDTNLQSAFRDGNWKWQERQMDAICSAMDSALVGFNLWNYNPFNDNLNGDAWNQEDFSIFSLDKDPPQIAQEGTELSEEARLNIGARVLDAFERPYAAKIAGIPVETTYEMNNLTYLLRFAIPISPPSNASTTLLPATVTSPPLVQPPMRARETEIHLPRRLYGAAHRRGAMRVSVRGGRASWRYHEGLQTLYVLHEDTTEGLQYTVRVSVHREGGRELVLGAGLLVLGLVIAAVGMYWQAQATQQTRGWTRR